MVKYRPMIIGRVDRHRVEFPLFDTPDEARRAAWKYLLKLSNLERQYTGVNYETVEDETEGTESKK